MLSFVLAVILPIALTSAATPTNETTDCQSISVSLNAYQHPNASSSYSIPAVVSTESTVTNSTTETWQIINSIGTASSVADPQAQQLVHSIFLDASSTINGYSLLSLLPFAGCSFTFGLPSNDNGKTSSDGSCSKIFGQSCLNEIMHIAQDTTATIPPAVGSRQLIDACGTVSETVNNYIATSSKACSKNGPSIDVSFGM